MPLVSFYGITNSSLSRILMLTNYYSISKGYKMCRNSSGNHTHVQIKAGNS